MEINQLKGLIDDLEILKKTIQNHTNSNDYIYAQMFDGWIAQCNRIINKISDNSASSFKVESWDYSSTGKTVKPTAVENLLSTIERYISRLDDSIIEISDTEAKKESPPHLLIFKINTGTHLSRRPIPKDRS